MIGKKYIAFDIGKTKILMGILKLSRNKNNFIEIAEKKNPHDPKKIEKIILDFCQDSWKRYWTKKIAISAAHLVDAENNIVRQGKECYGTDVFSFQFIREYGFSTGIENDGRCFALGEYYFGKGKQAKNILTFTLGTEIGGGFILSGKNYRGNNGSALEASHISANYLGPWQDWASYCAGKGIENFYRRKTGKKKKAEEIFAEVEKNNQIAKEVISKAADVLGKGIASLINILDPEMIVFGGSLSKQKNFINQAVKIARKNVFNKKANYKFAISSLGNKANLLGAVKNFIDNA